VQSDRLTAYDAALDRLRNDGLAYPCFCTRADIAAQIAASISAPHDLQPDGPDGPAYPGTCRALDPAQSADRIAAGAPHCWRLAMGAAMARIPDALIWHDARHGAIIANPAPFGDIVLARRDAPAAYHLASTVDDAHQGISHVVRGADLFAATHIHRLLQALLGLRTPAYHHHALIAGPDGRRLAKRHDAASIAAMRDHGVDPAALIADLRSARLPLGYGWLNA
jgi:glutamyl-Q tRNA(Asp) synthetase